MKKSLKVLFANVFSDINISVATSNTYIENNAYIAIQGEIQW